MDGGAQAGSSVAAAIDGSAEWGHGLRTMGGLRIGRIFGISIRVDWSLFIAVWLVTVSLASGTFPIWHPDWSVGLRWGIGLMSALLFFGSVLLHELSHALVGRAYGLEVKSIILFIFGGMANIEREPSTPRAEFLMAIVGPLVSIALGFAFLAIGAGLAGGVMSDPTRMMRDLGPMSTLLFWLGPVNVLIGLFNLLPGLPLDGGRVLRAILWRATGSLERSTRIAAGVGRGLGLLLVFSGVAMIFGVRLPVFGTGLISGLWLVFIGWFLASAAAASYRQLVVTTLLEGVPVRRLMHRDVVTVAPEVPLVQFVDEVLMRTDQRAFPVVAGERLHGLVCLEDVRKVPRGRWESAQVKDVMTPVGRLSVIGPDEELNDAMRLLSRLDVEQLPVVRDEQLVGVLRRRDILRWLEVQGPAMGESMTPQPQ